ncbi:hypothetical protein CVU83_00830 [Candidatus Falkowbacteria bacterium HGW-Falkowbacteria-2]|uniref:Uncharacterized protein n=1 Tax=Candidatus Falkowbacteria bacterium HGW-Falkowbacteria-2 TaxID=2013769 RepID=A0A2N2E2S0_9BACT|nr:MAG: hypothetical protein CVU83_00830 [Candidatus Falkowbacteria bacterium HGW-Falkowbacteria-2]
MKKIIMVAGVFCLLLLVWSVRDGKSKEQSVYTGDAVYYKNRVVIATAASGKLDFYSLAGERVDSLFSVGLALNPTKEEVFNDVKLVVSGDKLTAYAIAGYTLYQYDISNLYTAELEKKTRNTYWDWYERVDRFGDRIVTVSKRGVSIWNNQLDIIDSYKLESESAYGVRSGGSNRFLTGMSDSSILVYDRESRSVLRTTPLNFSNFKKNGRKPFYDRISNNVYVIDDYYVKKIDVNGVLTASYRHSGDSSFDVESTADNDFLYASNGLKVMKLKKSDLTLVSEVSTGSLGAAQGWAMGLKLVNTAFGDRLVVFNNSSILVLDSNLKLVAHAGKISKDDNLLYPIENLYLVLDHNSATAGAIVNLQGGGFWPNEDLSVKLVNSTITAKADRFGRFNVDVPVPTTTAGRYDIKVDGMQSNLTYSISFSITE